MVGPKVDIDIIVAIACVIALAFIWMIDDSMRIWIITFSLGCIGVLVVWVKWAGPAYERLAVQQAHQREERETELRQFIQETREVVTVIHKAIRDLSVHRHELLARVEMLEQRVRAREIAPPDPPVLATTRLGPRNQPTAGHSRGQRALQRAATREAVEDLDELRSARDAIARLDKEKPELRAQIQQRLRENEAAQKELYPPLPGLIGAGCSYLIATARRVLSMNA